MGDFMGKAGDLIVFALLAMTVSASATETAVVKRAEQALQQVIQQHSQANDFHSYWDSDHTPDKLFGRWLQDSQAQKLADASCQIMAHLSSEDLSLFQDAVENHPFGQLMNCRSSLLATVVSFFDTAREEILNKLPALPLIDGRSGEPGEGSFLGPSIEMDLNTKGGPVYVRADLDTKYIAFTFDDGPHSRNTEPLLKILEDEKVEATFFMVGDNVKAHPKIVKQVAAKGHSVGNHTWSHQNLHKTGFDGGVDEIMDGFKAIWDVLGYSHPFFRFPYGNKTKKLQSFVQANDFGTFFWNVDTLDWKHKNPDTLYEYALKQIEKERRGIVLFHDVQPQTVVIMPMLLHALKAKGYIPVVFRAPTVGHDRPLP